MRIYQIYKVISSPHIRQGWRTISGRTRRPLFVCLFHDFIVLILFLVSCPIGGAQHGHSGGPIAGRPRPWYTPPKVALRAAIASGFRKIQLAYQAFRQTAPGHVGQFAAVRNLWIVEFLDEVVEHVFQNIEPLFDCDLEESGSGANQE